MEENDLDVSWINEYSRIHSIQQIMNREEIDSIAIQTIYMNNNLEISKINKEMLGLCVNNARCISKEQLFNIIQSKKNSEKTKYRLFDAVWFSVDLDPKDIQKYVNGECNEIAKMQSINIANDLIISPSLFIFHSLHTLYLFFVNVETGVKSILKGSHSLDAKKLKHTKKVRIIENDNIDEFNKTIGTKKTRKVWGSVKQTIVYK